MQVKHFYIISNKLFCDFALVKTKTIFLFRLTQNVRPFGLGRFAKSKDY